MTHPGRTEAHPWYGKMTPMQTPPYQQLANDLRAEIEAGTIEAGSWLPAVRKLSETRGVAKGTVAAALRLLVDEGRLEAKPNKGFRVLQSPSPVVLLLDGAGRLRTLDPGRLEVPRTQIEPVSTEVTAALDGTSVGEELLVRRAELLTDGEPYGSNATYFPRAVADRRPGPGRDLAHAGADGPLRYTRPVACLAGGRRRAAAGAAAPRSRRRRAAVPDDHLATARPHRTPHRSPEALTAGRFA
jgi:hypothetical protein